MELSGTARGCRSHQFVDGDRRSRSPALRRVPNHASTRRNHHYLNQDSENHVSVKSKLNEDNIPASENPNHVKYNNYRVSSAEDLRRHFTTHDLQDNVDAGESDVCEMMTFRTFVITTVDESCDPLASVKAYEAYKKDFESRYVLGIHWIFRDLPAVAERYDTNLCLRQHEETSRACQMQASQFVKNLMEDMFFGISFVDRFSSPRSCLDYKLPFLLHVGPSIVNNESANTPLRAPFWFPPDPDEFCLCWKNVPMNVSKWDVLSHLTATGAVDGLSDITLTLSKNFVLSLNSVKSPPRTFYRHAWIKYTSDEACTAADTKVDGTRCKDAVCRLIRRVTNLSSYTVRVAPSETCHAVRILRDLHISARLILKLDLDFGVTEVLSGNGPDMEKEATDVNMVENNNEDEFRTACQNHPVLSEFANVVLNEAGHSAEEQLDIQLLYLRLVHNKFTSQRELWNTVGALYVRPTLVDAMDIQLLLPGFGGDHDGWDKNYIEAEDVWGQDVEPAPAIKVVEGVDGEDSRVLVQSKVDSHVDQTSHTMKDTEKLFLEKLIPDAFFEPREGFEVQAGTKTEEDDEDDPFHTTGLCHSTLEGRQIKVEEAAPITARYDGNATNSTHTDRPSPPQGAHEGSDVTSFPRGRASPWLKVLDARLRLLFRETVPIDLDENGPYVQAEWDAFCASVIEKYYDADTDMEKWSCPACVKQFRGLQYVKNHLRHKHSERFNDVVARTVEKYIRRRIHEDPYKLPVTLPAPTPYLYRMKNFRMNRRQDPHYPSNNSVPIMNVAQSPSTLESSFATYMNHGVGSRLAPLGGANSVGSRVERTYRDWDAPQSVPGPMSQGNLRTFVLYDDL